MSPVKAHGDDADPDAPPVSPPGGSRRVPSRRGRSNAEATATTRAALLDAGARLFAEHGYGEVSLAQVAAAAGVTKGAAYHHFGAKAAVFEAVFHDQEQRVHSVLRDAFDHASDPVAGTRAVLAAFLEACDDRHYGAIVFRDGPLALGWNRWRECEDDYGLALVSRILDDLHHSGRLTQPVTEVHAPVLLAMLSSAGQLLAQTPPEIRSRPRQQLLALFDQVLHGLLTDPADTDEPAQGSRRVVAR